MAGCLQRTPMWQGRATMQPFCLKNPSLNLQQNTAELNTFSIVQVSRGARTPLGWPNMTLKRVCFDDMSQRFFPSFQRTVQLPRNSHMALRKHLQQNNPQKLMYSINKNSGRNEIKDTNNKEARTIHLSSGVYTWDRYLNNKQRNSQLCRRTIPKLYVNFFSGWIHPINRFFREHASSK